MSISIEKNYHTDSPIASDCKDGRRIEKGPDFVIPGFVPDPLGEIHEYIPNLLKLMVSFGIWALGLLVFTLPMKVAIPIETGKFCYSKHEQEKRAF